MKKALRRALARTTERPIHDPLPQTGSTLRVTYEGGGETRVTVDEHGADGSFVQRLTSDGAHRTPRLAVRVERSVRRASVKAVGGSALATVEVGRIDVTPPLPALTLRQGSEAWEFALETAAGEEIATQRVTEFRRIYTPAGPAEVPAVAVIVVARASLPVGLLCGIFEANLAVRSE